MKRDCFKMKVLWAVALIVNKLYGRRLIGSDIRRENDKWGVPFIIINTKVTELRHTTGVIQRTDKFIWGVKTILYCFNLKPYKI